MMKIPLKKFNATSCMVYMDVFLMNKYASDDNKNISSTILDRILPSPS